MQIKVVVTVPDKILDTAAVVSAIKMKQQGKTAPEVKALFRQTVVGWRNKPEFRSRREDSANSIGVTIHSSGSNSDQYALVNAGARPHPIFPVTAPFLAFRTGYRASTRPRILSSHAAVRSGAYVHRMSVNHPGFEAREFDQEIAEQYTPIFQRDMQDAINSSI